jgi:DNA repair ATPase RecN
VLNGVSELAAAVRERRRQLDREAGAAEQVALAGKAAAAEVEVLAHQVELHEQVGALLTRVGEEAQETARAQVEGLVTRALQVVFGPQLTFHVVPDEVGGQAVLRLTVRSDYGGAVTEMPVLDAHGGGLAAVVGFVLRLVVLLLTPGSRRLLVLDETFAHLSRDRVEAMASFLREVADKAHVQLFLVTHDPDLGAYADSRVMLALGADGMTRVTQDEAE